MGIMSFFKEAGQKLFGHTEAKAAEAAAQPDPAEIQRLNTAAGEAIATYIGTMGLEVSGLQVEVDASQGAVTVSGEVASQDLAEKVALCCGNVHGVASVNNMLTVAEPADESQYYTVVSGDNLSKISKEFYGTPNKYPVIFEANKPMLTHPDKIYPGQLLRIPPQ